VSAREPKILEEGFEHTINFTAEPTSSGAGAFTLADGTTNIPDPRPHFVDFGPNGIRNTAAAGFKVTLGASVSCLVTGAFGSVTTA
jgi:hypothetical protein